jgi:hypothetical protein
MYMYEIPNEYEHEQKKMWEIDLTHILLDHSCDDILISMPCLP